MALYLRDLLRFLSPTKRVTVIMYGRELVLPDRPGNLILLCCHNAQEKRPLECAVDGTHRLPFAGVGWGTGESNVAEAGDRFLGGEVCLASEGACWRAEAPTRPRGGSRRGKCAGVPPGRSLRTPEAAHERLHLGKTASPSAKVPVSTRIIFSRLGSLSAVS